MPNSQGSSNNQVGSSDPISIKSSDQEVEGQKQSILQAQKTSSFSVSAVKVKNFGKVTSKKEQLYVTDVQPREFKKLGKSAKRPAAIEEEESCVLCGNRFQKRKMTSYGCKHLICALCEKDYAIGNIFQEMVPFCPSQGCTRFLRLSSDNFYGLPGEVQEKYKKVYENFEKNGSNVSRDQQNSLANLFRKSQSELNSNEFDNARKYRRCSKCNQLCDHIGEEMKIQCKCGNTFCYLCGNRWILDSHQCKFIRKLKKNRSAKISKKNEIQLRKLQPERSFLKQFLVALLWVPIFIFVLLPKAVLFFALVLIMSGLAGISFYAVSYVINLDKIYKKVFFIIFFPFAMILGIGMAWTIFFNGFVMEEIQSYHSIKNCLLSI